MKRAHRRRVGVLAVLIAIAAAILVAAGAASAITVLEGNLVIEINGATSPKALPKDRMAPISFHGSASVATRDGSHIPPALDTQLLIDKHIRIDTTGLPTCTPGQIQSTTPEGAMKACGAALIGRGTSTAQVQFPESTPFTAKGPLLAFNGPSGGGYGGKGYREQLYYVYARVPVPTTLIAVGKVSKGTGKYGYKISISIPKIAGGSGSFSGADFTIN
ncbi:MAG TPA: hypothetical protein VII45_13375, partial [Solirubrobacterales bacterium]